MIFQEGMKMNKTDSHIRSCQCLYFINSAMYRNPPFQEIRIFFDLQIVFKISANLFWDELEPFLTDNKVLGRPKRICLLSDLLSFLTP